MQKIERKNIMQIYTDKINYTTFRIISTNIFGLKGIEFRQGKGTLKYFVPLDKITAIVFYPEPTPKNKCMSEKGESKK